MEMITEQDLKKELAHKELQSLSDINAKGEVDTQIISDCISDAIGFIESFFQIPKKPTTLLKDICTKLTIIELKRRNAYPAEELSALKNECIALLTKMRSGKIPLSSQEQKNGGRGFKHNNTRIQTKRLYD